MVSDEDYAAVKKVKYIDEKFGRKAAGKYCRHFYGQSLLDFYARRVMGAEYSVDGSVQDIDRLIDGVIKATDLHISRLKGANASLEKCIQIEQARRELAVKGFKLDG
ncbi:MAG: hypothetical protein AABX47_10245 [Nanoarchaeota archaeon]